MNDRRYILCWMYSEKRGKRGKAAARGRRRRVSRRFSSKAPMSRVPGAQIGITCAALLEQLAYSDCHTPAAACVRLASCLVTRVPASYPISGLHIVCPSPANVAVPLIVDTVPNETPVETALYDLLGVSPTATEGSPLPRFMFTCELSNFFTLSTDEIKKAYYKKVRRVVRLVLRLSHPCIGQGAPSRACCPFAPFLWLVN